jgi:hypothetical protein
MKRRSALLVAVLTMLATVVVTGQAAARGRTVVVPRDFSTIQAAIDAAQSGARIEVRPGVYVEELVITKDVQLVGTGTGATIVKSPAALTSYGVHLPDGRALTAVVRVQHGAHVRISQLTVSGPIPCGIETSGINVLQAATLDLSHARVTSIAPDPATCAADDAAGRAVVYGIPPHIEAEGVRGSTAFGRIDHVLVDGYQHAGISVAGPDTGGITRVSVVHNTVVGGPVLPSFQYGIHVAGDVIAHVAGNRVVGNVCAAPYCGPDPINEAQAAGIFLQSAIAGTTVVHNRLTGNDVGVYQVVSPGCCVIARNTLIRNRYFGILIQDGDGATHSNRIVGGQTGIGVVADFIDTTGVLRHDRIRATTLADIRTIDCCGVTARAIVRP